MGKLEVNTINVLEKLARTPKTTQGTYNRTVKKLEYAKAELLKEFEDSKITKEIEEGANADNISGTLSGLQKGGNLFSFIGFLAGTNPIQTLREILEDQKNYKIDKNPNIKTFKTTNSIEVRYNISYPSIESIIEQMGDEAEFPDRWRDGSWLTMISSGIFGLSYYLYDEEFGQYEQSRSEAALEAKKKDGSLIRIRGNSQSKPTKWLQSYLRNFAINLRSKSK